MKEHIIGIACTSTELISVLKDLHNQYKQDAGVEICVRYGTRKGDVDPNRVAIQIWVYRIGGKSIYQGTHAEMYNQDVIGETV